MFCLDLFYNKKMNNLEIVNRHLIDIEQELDNAKISKSRKKILKNLLKELLLIVANDIDKRENFYREEKKDFILPILGYYLVEYSKDFTLKNLNDAYEEIMRNLAFAVYELVLMLKKQHEVSDDKFYEVLNAYVYDEYLKILKYQCKKMQKNIKLEEVNRNSVNFWQMIFIKYTSDNNRIFYPSFFSDGYFIMSEQQFKNYQKFGNKFFIVLFFLFLILAKTKALKAIFYFKLLSFQTFMLILAVLSVIGIIYNIVVPRLIFKNSIKTQEKFWVNNYESVEFIKISSAKILITFLISTFIIAAAVNINNGLIAGVALLTFLGFVVCVVKIAQKADLFAKQQEIKAIKSFSLKELNKYNEIVNYRKIKQNAEKYLYDCIEYMYKVSNLDYSKITQNITFFIKYFIKFNSKLYKLQIDEKEHLKVIEERFLPHFEFV